MQGDTALDCLIAWRNRYRLEEKRDLDENTLRDYKIMVHKLKTAIEKGKLSI